jgi:hypothetical protein
MLDSYIVTLPDGSQGALSDFYAGIMDESITATDAGYILSDGTLVQTNGEAMWNPDADVLISLMSPYLEGVEIVEDSGASDSAESADDEDYENDVITNKKPFYKTPVGMGMIVLGAYVVYDKYIK